MSSSCRCAGAIIARPIAAGMKPHGGKMPALTRPRLPALCGWRPIPCRMEHAKGDTQQLERLWRKRRSRKKLNAIEDATLAHIIARYMAFASGPEMQGRARLAELKEKERRLRVAFGPPLSYREQALLFCLSTLYPQQKADRNHEFLAEQSAFATVEVDDDDRYPLEYQRAKAPPLADAGHPPPASWRLQKRWTPQRRRCLR